MNIIHQLEETKKLTETLFDLSQIDLDKTYAKGKWNVQKILVHLADAESVLNERIKRIIAGPEQTLLAFDQDLWCKNLDYQNFPLTISHSLFSSNRESLLFLANKYYLEFGHKEFKHSHTGKRTLKDEFDKVASHNQGHLNQIFKALNS